MSRRGALVALVATGALITGCASSHPSGSAPSEGFGPSGASSTASNALAASAQWWKAGATYCDMLKQTLAAGRSVLPRATASDPTLHAVSTAWVSDIERAAPASVAPSWKVVGDLIVKLVQANGDPSAVQGVDAAKVHAAVAAVSSDARTRCGVQLSAAVH